MACIFSIDFQRPKVLETELVTGEERFELRIRGTRRQSSCPDHRRHCQWASFRRGYSQRLERVLRMTPMSRYYLTVRKRARGGGNYPPGAWFAQQSKKNNKRNTIIVDKRQPQALYQNCSRLHPQNYMLLIASEYVENTYIQLDKGGPSFNTQAIR